MAGSQKSLLSGTGRLRLTPALTSYGLVTEIWVKPGGPVGCSLATSLMVSLVCDSAVLCPDLEPKGEKSVPVRWGVAQRERVY